MYSLPIIIAVIIQMMIKCAGYVYCCGEKRNVYRLLVDKPEEKTCLRSPIFIWEDNVNVNHIETW
jgi:hypothetical protein